MEDNRKNPDPIGRELDVEFYRFSGGSIADTRNFCRERDSKIFHYKEVMDWTQEDWDGKHLDANEETIFKYVGGSCAAGDRNEKCLHTLMPVSVVIVPKEVLYRSIRKGYYRTTQFEIEELKLTI